MYRTCLKFGTESRSSLIWPSQKSGLVLVPFSIVVPASLALGLPSSSTKSMPLLSDRGFQKTKSKQLNRVKQHMPRAASYRPKDGPAVEQYEYRYLKPSTCPSRSWEDEPLRIRTKAQPQTLPDLSASIESWEDDIPPIISRAGTRPSRRPPVSSPGLEYPDDERSERSLNKGRSLTFPSQMFRNDQAQLDRRRSHHQLRVLEQSLLQQQQHFPEDEISSSPSREDLDTTLSTLATLLTEEDETKQQSVENDCEAPGLPFFQRYSASILGSVANCEVANFGSDDGNEGCRPVLSEEEGEDESKLTYDENGIICGAPATTNSYERNDIESSGKPGKKGSPRKKKSRARKIASFLTGIGRTKSLTDSLTSVTESLDEEEAKVVTSVSRQLKKERSPNRKKRSSIAEEDDEDTWAQEQTEDYGNECFCRGLDEQDYLVRFRHSS